MLDNQKIREVMQWLDSGLHSQRSISRMTGVSRAVVQRIASGKRKEAETPVKAEWEVDWNERSFERCPRCGALVRVPCMACIIREVAAKTDVPTYPDSPGSILDLKLEKEHRKRYEKVRAWREAQKDPNFTEIPDDWPFRKRFKKAGRPRDAV